VTKTETKQNKTQSILRRWRSAHLCSDDKKRRRDVQRPKEPRNTAFEMWSQVHICEPSSISKCTELINISPISEDYALCSVLTQIGGGGQDSPAVQEIECNITLHHRETPTDML
jgi:hypothetical protein